MPKTNTNDRLPPLDTVSTVDPPKPAGDENPAVDGRTAKGTFGPGNTFARGNLNARKMAALRCALLESMTPERMKKIGDRLYVAAINGSWIATKLLLLYAIGKPPDAEDAGDAEDAEDAARTMGEEKKARVGK